MGVAANFTAPTTGDKYFTAVRGYCHHEWVVTDRNGADNAVGGGVDDRHTHDFQIGDAGKRCGTDGLFEGKQIAENMRRNFQKFGLKSIKFGYTKVLVLSGNPICQIDFFQLTISGKAVVLVQIRVSDTLF